jgi:hypothetical protein
LIGSLKEASGTPDAAVGKVDVQVAESGIALLMQLGPLLSKVDEREETVIDTHMQMYHDICQMWIPAYEGLTNPTAAMPIHGDPLPENRDIKFKEIMAMWQATPPLVDIDWVHDELRKLGYDFPKDALNKILSERQALAQATDPFAARMMEEEETGA